MEKWFAKKRRLRIVDVVGHRWMCWFWLAEHGSSILVLIAHPDGIFLEEVLRRIQGRVKRRTRSGLCIG